MTNPQPPSDSSSPQTEDDEASLVPVLLTVYALYLLWRGANHGFRGNTTTVRRVLDLERTVGQALSNVALRALEWQRMQVGRPGDQLWSGATQAVRDAVNVGLDVLADALLWTDRNTSSDPTTTDSGSGATGEPTVPTAADPPTLLAQLVATAVANAAMVSAAATAGWTRKTWQTRQDDRVREAHRLLQGQTRPLGDAFEVQSHKIRYPGDPEVPLSLRAGCRCWLTMAR